MVWLGVEVRVCCFVISVTDEILQFYLVTFHNTHEARYLPPHQYCKMKILQYWCEKINNQTIHVRDICRSRKEEFTFNTDAKQGQPSAMTGCIAHTVVSDSSHCETDS